MTKIKKNLIWVGLWFFGVISVINYVNADISIARPALDLTPLDELTNIAGPGVITILSADLADPKGLCYFQWWNNYCFTVNPKTSLMKAIWHSYDNSRYRDDTFRKITTTTPYDYWLDWSHDWVRWWAGDAPGNNRSAVVSNVLGRKWPCPVGYHVPSAWEWWLLVRYWRDTYALDVPLYGNNWLYYFKDAGARAGFMSYFNLGYHWSFFYSDALLHNKWEVGYYWSSSPSGPVSTTNYARRMTLTSAGAYSSDTYYRSRGFPIRCFKNPY